MTVIPNIQKTQKIRNIVSFRVGSQWYGLDIEHITEILYLVMLNEPLSSNPDVLGIMTVRNVVMPVIDLRLKFGIPDPEFRLDTPVITVHTQRGAMGIVVDDIDNIEHIDEDQITANLGTEFPYISGTAQVKDQLVMLVNMGAISGQ
jgi:purine-binding chemotaxis protein CheW